jgi:hypothetical protein
MKKYNWKERTKALTRCRGTNSISTARKVYLSSRSQGISICSPARTLAVRDQVHPRPSARRRMDSGLRRRGGTQIKEKQGIRQTLAPRAARVWRVEHRAEEAKPRARARLGRGTISREVGWETGRLSETNVGAREEPSAGCKIDTVVGQQERCGAEREV